MLQNFVLFSLRLKGQYHEIITELLFTNQVLLAP
jgi:hypothetical protein